MCTLFKSWGKNEITSIGSQSQSTKETNCILQLFIMSSSPFVIKHPQVSNLTLQWSDIYANYWASIQITHIYGFKFIFYVLFLNEKMTSLLIVFSCILNARRKEDWNWTVLNLALIFCGRLASLQTEFQMYSFHFEYHFNN